MNNEAPKTNDTIFSVNNWGSHPSKNNDDCWTGEDFSTYDEAYEAFHAAVTDADTAFIELTGGDFYLVRKNPAFNAAAQAAEAARFNRAWASEIATQAGMAFGCAGFNDVMGY